MWKVMKYVADNHAKDGFTVMVYLLVEEDLSWEDAKSTARAINGSVVKMYGS